MIRECEEHGYFRDDVCPLCGEEGKFVMSDKEIERVGRTMAAILRHGKFEPDMDDQGYVSLQDVAALIRKRHPYMSWLRGKHIEAIVGTDVKGRYMISNGSIRATYGHTIPLNIRLDGSDVPSELYYPVAVEDVDAILSDGISPTDRSMVHLSLTFADARRAGEVRLDDPVVLEVDTARCISMGEDIGKAATTVFLCRRVPPGCIKVADQEAERWRCSGRIRSGSATAPCSVADSTR